MACRANVVTAATAIPYQRRFLGGGGRGAALSEISPPPVAPKKFKIRPSHAKIVCISCHFNAFTFFDILMIYITY